MLLKHISAKTVSEISSMIFQVKILFGNLGCTQTIFDVLKYILKITFTCIILFSSILHYLTLFFENSSRKGKLKQLKTIKIYSGNSFIFEGNVEFCGYKLTIIFVKKLPENFCSKFTK